jgi:hypothetical protein
VEEAALGLGVSSRTIRRWLHEQRLAGHKTGGVWVVLGPLARPGSPGTAGVSPRAVRARLRAVGERLITRGNQCAGARRRRGGLFLTWRRPRSLQIVLALGRQSPQQTWAPHTLGTTLPFWLTAPPQWQTILPVLQQYERVRGWCHPRLLRLPGVGQVVMTELARVAALERWPLPAPRERR